ncbi:MAG: TlpA disulfide reductase family protein [Cyclobacteriaceae bacterium]
MKKIFQNSSLKKLVVAARPWAIFIGIFFLLKVTGIGSSISFLTQSAMMKAGVMDMQPENTVDNEQTFSYDFTIKDLDGKKLEMADLKGKVIFLNLWATWCGPCRVEMPSIQNLYNSVDKYKIAFVILSLDTEDQHSKIVQYIRVKEFSFPVYQPASPLPKLLRVNTIPTTFIIGTDGKVKTKKVGMANYDTEEMRVFLGTLTGGS